MYKRDESHSYLSEIATWIAICLALSPVLVDIAEHILTHSWTWYSLVFPFLLLRSGSLAQQRRTSSGIGYFLLAVSLAICILGSIGGDEFIRFARISIPLGIIGLALVFGRPHWKVAILSLWFIPIPNSLLNLFSPAMERTLLYMSTSIASVIVPSMVAKGSILHSPGGEFSVGITDSGIALAALLSGLGYYHAILNDLHLKESLRRAAWFGCLAFPLQWVALVVAVFLVGLGFPTTARLFLIPYLFLWIALGAVCLIEYHSRRATT